MATYDEQSQTTEVAEEMSGIFGLLEEEILNSEMSNEEKTRFIQKVYRLSTTKTHIMIVGATGAGKSSTINAIFNSEAMHEIARDENESPAATEYQDFAGVGVGTDPETDEIRGYELGNLVLWDTPGLGDGYEADDHHTKEIIRKLSEFDEDGHPLIDLVLVVLDASSKDLSTSYKLINEIIIPAMGKDNSRIIVGINQADIAMRGGAHWNYTTNEPDEALSAFLDEKVESIKARILKETGVSIDPVYYCAGFKEADGPQNPPYNLTKLLYYIIKSVPANKRLALVDNLNEDESAWEHDDRRDNYKRRLYDSIGDAIADIANDGADIGKEILGWPGWVIGKVIGGFFGIFVGVIDRITN